MKRVGLLVALFLSLQAVGQTNNKPQLNEDYTFNKVDFSARKMHYRPDETGRGVVCVDGVARFNRALYGAHTGFRMECSDQPEFGIYLPGMGGNLQLTLPEGSCTARYEAGRMEYWQGGIHLEAQVRREGADMALWRITNTTNQPLTVGFAFGGVSGQKFFRNGDLGVDDPNCFAFVPAACSTNHYSKSKDGFQIDYLFKGESKQVQLIVPLDHWKISRLPHLVGEFRLKPHEERYIAYLPVAEPCLTQRTLAKRFAAAEQARKALIANFSIDTPDPYITPIAEALAIAADGIWSGRTWLHGAVGWRSEYTGWRGAYVGDAIGWHDRARTHFRTYAENMVRDVEPTLDHPRQDSTLNLARAEKRWGTPMYSNGYICRRPGKREMSHYDMNLVYIDALLRHIRATGDEAFMREMYPTLQLHLAWEKRNFDPDGDHLYDGYACIWASDALYYNGGAATHSSAYNYFANREMARIAERIGEDPTPYREEAEAIEKAMFNALWHKEGNHWGEYKDLMGHGRLHTSPALWTIYHAIDSEVGSVTARNATAEYIRQLPHLPVTSPDFDEVYALPATSDWQPYIWSINNVATAEVMHAALAYWQAEKREEAFQLMKGMALDNMYLGTSPLNFGQISYLDAARGECYRDFADPIGVWSRALTEGLFGIRPDLIAGKVEICPGFPQAWNHASINLPKINYRFERHGTKEIYTIEHRYPKQTMLELSLRSAGIQRVEIYDQKGLLESREFPETDPQKGSSWDRWKFQLKDRDRFRVEVTYRWLPEPEALQSADRSYAVITAQAIENEKASYLPIDLSGHYNASVSEIYRNEYLAPRPAVTTLQIPKQGYGDWCHPQATAEIDDTGLRTLLREKSTHERVGSWRCNEIPFLLAHTGNNVIYTSLWENYPTAVELPISGCGERLLLLMAGSTNHMQSHIANGILRVHYTDGTSSSLELINPDNWASIEQVGVNDGYSYRAPALWRLSLQNGIFSRTLDQEMGIEGINRIIPGGAATLVEMEIEPKKELRSLTLETLSNDVVIGVMGITIERRE